MNPTGRRLALLIATYEHDDSGLRRLTAPGADARALADVLRDPTIAGFDVTVLVNEPHYRVGEAIAELYHDRRRDDLTLLYFTGHGLKDDDGRLYLAMRNTRRDNLVFTGLSAEQLDHAIESCGSRQKILILDCCYSGAFPAGTAVKADTEVHALQRFQGRGRSVLTASDSTQYSFEGEQIVGEARQSVFTRHLVAGLRDGSADLDGDGDITIDELYSYVHDRVIEEMPRQRPKKQTDVEGRTVIARNVSWQLPSYLQNALKSPIATDRLSALDGLAHLHRVGNDHVQDEVRVLLERLVDDDSRAVSTAATGHLSAISSEPRSATTAVPVQTELTPDDQPEVLIPDDVEPPAAILLVCLFQFVLILTPVGRTDIGLGIAYSLLICSLVGAVALVTERKLNLAWVRTAAVNLAWLFLYSLSSVTGIPPWIGASFAVLPNIIVLFLTYRAARNMTGPLRWIPPIGSAAIAIILWGLIPFVISNSVDHGDSAEHGRATLPPTAPAAPSVPGR